MIVEKGNKLLIVYRALYDKSTRRHFLGEIVAVEGAVCRVEGYAFVHDPKLETYKRKPEKRVTIIDLAESGYVVNIIDSSVNIDAVTYKYLRDIGMVATDDKNFTLNINEFGMRS